jgi:excisionase family DNA binding protein
VSDPRAPLARARAAGMPKPLTAPPDVITELLGVVARQAGADPASFLSEVLIALRVRALLLRGVYPPRGKPREPETVALVAADVIEKAVCFYLAAGDGAASPSALPASLGIPGGEVGADSQMAGLSEADEITSGQAAELLGLSAERVRQLIDEHKIDGWQDSTGRHAWHVVRASVIAYRERRGGGHGHGGTARRSA